MVDAAEFLEIVRNNGIDFCTGVPDSALKSLLDQVDLCFAHEKHITAPNEGAAIGLAMGYFATTGKVPMVYMQNSGLGNAINPLVSLADPMIASVPMLLVVGWRGEIMENGNQIVDEPQHKVMGRITPKILDDCDIPYEICSEKSNINVLLRDMIVLARKRKGPCALIVRTSAFAKKVLHAEKKKNTKLLSRETALRSVLSHQNESSPVIATTGMISRELFEFREIVGQSHDNDLLVVGGMGHASAIACGVAKFSKLKKVICLDGDGAALMHLGSMSLLAKQPNILHILFNNGAHDSVGGQSTCAPELHFCNVAKALGYSSVARLHSVLEIKNFFEDEFNRIGSVFVEVVCEKGARANLGRPTISPYDNIRDFNRKQKGME